MHSLSAHRLCVTEAKMAARWPSTPPSSVTAAGVDSSGPIGHTRKGIDFCPRTGCEWAYLKHAPTQSQLPSSECSGAVHYIVDFDGFRYALGANRNVVLGPGYFWRLFVCLFVCAYDSLCMPVVALLPQRRLSQGATQSIPGLRLKKLGAALPLALW